MNLIFYSYGDTQDFALDLQVKFLLLNNWKTLDRKQKCTYHSGDFYPLPQIKNPGFQSFCKKRQNFILFKIMHRKSMKRITLRQFTSYEVIEEIEKLANRFPKSVLSYERQQNQGLNRWVNFCCFQTR